MLAKLIGLRLKGMLYRNSTMRSGKRRRGGCGMALVLLILLIYCVAVFGAMFFMMFRQMAGVMAGTSFAWFYFAVAGLFAFALSFFFTAFTAKSELFEAKDNELLLSMPLHPRTILMSRMAVLLLSEYLISLLVLIPAGLAWFLTAGVEAATLILYIVCSLMLPLLSVSIACLFGWLLALLTSRARNKTLITMLLSLAFLAVYFYVYYNANRYITALISNHEAIARGMRGWGFLFCWYGEGIAQARPAETVGLCAIALGAFALMTMLLSRGFLKATSTGSSRRKRAGGKVELRSATVSVALLRRERKRFTSSAIYMMNCGLGLILSVIAAVAVLLKRADLYALFAQLQLASGMSASELTLLAAVGLSFLASMDMITAPSVSLEGKTLWILRSAPIPTRQILNAKLKLHLLFCAPPALLLSVAAGVVLEADVAGWLALLLIPQLFVLLSGAFGLIMNLLLPKLDWTSETVAVKQSGAVVASMLILMFYIVLGFVGFIFLVMPDVISVRIYLLLYLGLSVVFCALCLMWLQKRGPRRFERLS